MISNLCLLLLSFACAFMQNTAGFGFAILFMAVSPLFLDYWVAQVAYLPVAILLNLSLVIQFRKHIRFKLFMIPLILSSILAYFCIDLAKTMQIGFLKTALGIFIFLLAVWFAFLSKKVRVRPSALNAGICGVVSGITTGFFSVSGPPIVLFYSSALDDRDEYMGTIQAYFFCNNIVNLLLRRSLGAFPSFPPGFFLIAIAGALLGKLAGSRLYKRLDGESLKKYIYILLALSGLWTAVSETIL